MGIIGTVFNIQRFSIHDGPGIRTTVFLKGCPLRCFWCHNPEGLRKSIEIQFYASRCIGCGECARVCPQGAQALDEQGRIYHRERCVVCGECVETCFAEGLQVVGKEMSVEAVVAEVLLDRAFYANSGGGVTLSGGEPLLQLSFALAILTSCKSAGIHTALETTTYCAWEALERTLPLTDLFMIDIKLLDSEKHRITTGVSNERILDNICRLATTDKPIVFRVPVVPGVNDSAEEIGAIAEFIHKLSGLRADRGAGISLELLPFHRLAEDKYTSLGLNYQASQLEPPDKEHMNALVMTARDRGIIVRGR